MPPTWNHSDTPRAKHFFQPCTHSSLKHYLIIADSHAKYVPTHIKTKSYDIIVKTISGLKWIDFYNQQLSLNHLLSTSQFHFLLSSVNSVLFLIGTNSVRIFCYSTILNQIREIMNFIRHKYLQLNTRNSIIISITFPCFKTTRRYSSERLLMRNIDN